MLIVHLYLQNRKEGLNLKTCFMFGHSDAPDSILGKIEEAIERHYLEYGVRYFYVGNRGNFDILAAKAAKRVKQRYPDLYIYLLLAYHPAERKFSLHNIFDGSYYPPLVNVPKRFAIIHANKYMVDSVASVICYVNHNGNSRNLLQYAQRRHIKDGLLVDNLSQHNSIP